MLLGGDIRRSEDEGSKDLIQHVWKGVKGVFEAVSSGPSTVDTSGIYTL